MRNRFLASLAAAVLALAFAAPATAQSGSKKGEWVQPPKTLPKTLPHAPHPNRTHNLDFLFGALKAAPDAETAKGVEERIWVQWMRSRSDTTTLLMTRVHVAVEAKDLDLALKLLDAIVKIKPGYVEGWNRRATIYYMKKDYGRAIADIREVLKREPRHFAALSGLGLILQDVGDDKGALEVYRRALAVYPRLQRIPDIVKRLQEEVEGRDI